MRISDWSSDVCSSDLRDPEAGLAALAGALAGDGGIGIMLYGTYGRSGVYPLQAVLRTMAGDRPLSEQVSVARRLPANLPPTRSAERRLGKECFCSCRSRRSPHH